MTPKNPDDEFVLTREWLDKILGLVIEANNNRLEMGEEVDNETEDYLDDLLGHTKEDI